MVRTGTLIDSKSTKYLWILSRTLELPQETLETILAEAQKTWL
ncbi:MAG: lipocalin family protein [Bacteroidales bacterium]|nr:lipocalin family protein [Bacteroidales bacterium]